MGTKHNKKRYLIVNYIQKPDKKFDEVVELSKKKIGAGKMAKSKVILDLVNKKVVKCVLPGTENVEYEKLEQHYQKYYAQAISEFLKN
tara:strand:+ start:209 stop:472 length:264 start_codon:yes stop_codon:yes gene_type:complete